MEEAKWAHSILKEYRDRIDLMLSSRPASVGTIQLIAATTELKNDIKAANSSGRINGRKIPIDGPARFLRSALRCAASEFRMRADTNPSRAIWSGTLRELRECFADYIERIRKEYPEVG